MGDISAVFSEFTVKVIITFEYLTDKDYIELL